MKLFWLGFLIGSIIFGGVAFAAARITLINGNGDEIGTSANPLYVTGV